MTKISDDHVIERLSIDELHAFMASAGAAITLAADGYTAAAAQRMREALAAIGYPVIDARTRRKP